MVDAQAQAQAQASAHDEAPAGGRLLLLQLGATNDASGTPDPDVLARCPVTVALYREAVAAGRPVTVLASGGEYSSSESSPFTFNPTATPHAEIVMAALVRTRARVRVRLAITVTVTVTLTQTLTLTLTPTLTPTSSPPACPRRRWCARACAMLSLSLSLSRTLTLT